MSHFIFTLTHPDATGSSRMIVHFAAALRRKGHEVTLVHGVLPKSDEHSSVIPEMQALGVQTVAEPGLRNPSSPFLVQRVAKICADRKPTALIGVQQRDRATAVQAAHRIGVPGFVSAQNTHVFWGRWPLNRIKERYYGWAMRNYARLVVCSSPVVQNEMISRFGLGKERTAYLPNAVDLKQLTTLSADDRQRIRHSFGIQPDEFMLVNVGRINVQKAQDLLLQAFARVNPQQRGVKLVLVGNVPQDAQQAQMLKYRDNLLQFVQQHNLGEHVIFAGWRDDVPAILAASDGYVHSARWEGFGIASFEGMGAALPTIWTDCWGRPDGFVDDVHGWLVPIESVDALHVAMERMLSLSADERQTMGQASRRFVAENYDSYKIAEKFVNLIETSLAC